MRMTSLTAFVLRHRRWIVGLWLLALVAGGVAAGARGGVGRRHRHPGDVGSAERVHSHGGDQRRIDAAGEADGDVAESVLPHVVPGADEERAVDLLQPAHLCHGRCRQLGPRRRRAPASR